MSKQMPECKRGPDIPKIVRKGCGIQSNGTLQPEMRRLQSQLGAFAKVICRGEGISTRPSRAFAGSAS